MSETTTTSNVMPSRRVSTPVQWDLESLFAGGPSGKPFADFRAALAVSIAELTRLGHALPEDISEATISAWEEFVLLLEGVSARIGDGASYAGCVASQNVNDELAPQIEAEMDNARAQVAQVVSKFEARARAQNDAAWNLLVARPRVAPIEFLLNELRANARGKMDPQLEELYEDLATTGFHAWNRMYDKLAGDVQVPWSEDGVSKTLSLGQLSSKMGAPERSVREKAFHAIAGAWQERAGQAAMALNSLAGFRIAVHKRRGWKSPLHEPLLLNRLADNTLDAMWGAIAEESPRLTQYTTAKQKLLGIDSYRWYDDYAPVGKSSSKIQWDDAWDFILEQVAPFSSDMKNFMETARAKSWVEGEDRAGKRGGAYCTTFHCQKQIRVFMTYGDTINDLGTLAHELGHGYHSHVLRDARFYASSYPMNLAETASIFSELLVTHASLKKVGDTQEKLAMLDQLLQNAVTFMCNIRSRFLFDHSFYSARTHGTVTVSELNKLMLDAQKTAYGKILSSDGYSPLFWASKLHFYLTDVPFYNFPYTYGYLFATAVYQRAREEGPAFADTYRDLLAHTGVMTSEALAQKFLGEDITQINFWRKAVQTALEPMDEFTRLVDEVAPAPRG